MLYNLELVYYIAIFAMGFFIVLVSTPTIIWTAIRHQIFDKEDLHRKNHKRNISNLGGVAIFCSFTISVLLFSSLFHFQQPVFLIIASIILFATGLKDDVYGIGSSTKLMLSIIVASILVFLGGFRLTSLYGVLNIGELNVVAGALFSILLIIFLNNAFNLIDGLDGLAGTIGVIVNVSFGLLFAYSGHVSSAFIAFAMVGATCGFLYYNFAPAKIFMGDTGALVLGMVSVTLAIQFIEFNKFEPLKSPQFFSAPAIAVAILIIPVFDSLLIFFLRIINKKSPFKGDRCHIHHRLQNLGLSDNQVVLVLGLINIILITFTFLSQRLGNFLLIFLLIGICLVLHVLLVYLDVRKHKMRFTFSSLLLKDAFREMSEL